MKTESDSSGRGMQVWPLGQTHMTCIIRFGLWARPSDGPTYGPICVYGGALLRLRLLLARCDYYFYYNHHLYIHISICSYIHISMYSYIHVFIYPYIHIAIYPYTHVSIYTCIHRSIHPCMRTSIYITIYIHVYTYGPIRGPI